MIKEYPLRIGPPLLDKHGDIESNSDIFILHNYDFIKSGILRSYGLDVPIDFDIDTNTINNYLKYINILSYEVIDYYTTSTYFYVVCIYQINCSFTTDKITPSSSISINECGACVIKFTLNSGYFKPNVFTILSNDTQTNTVYSLVKDCAKGLFFNGFNWYYSHGWSDTAYYKWDGVVTHSPTALTFTGIEPKHITPFYNYFICTENANNKHLIFYSDPEDPESFDQTKYLTIGLRNDSILALVPYNGFLFIFKEKTIWVMSGGSPDEWTITQVSSEMGLFSSSSYILTNGNLYFLDEELNLKMIDGSNNIQTLITREQISLLIQPLGNSNLDPLSENYNLQWDTDSYLYSIKFMNCIFQPSNQDSSFYILFLRTGRSFYNQFFLWDPELFQPNSAFKYDCLTNSLSINSNVNTAQSDNTVSSVNTNIVVGDNNIEYKFYIANDEDIDRLFTMAPATSLSYKLTKSQTSPDYDFYRSNIMCSKTILDDGVSKKLKYIRVHGRFLNKIRITVFVNYPELFDKFISVTGDDTNYNKFTDKLEYDIINLSSSDFNYTSGTEDDFFDITQKIRMKPLVFRKMLIVIENILDNTNAIYKVVDPYIKDIAIGYEELQGRSVRY